MKILNRLIESKDETVYHLSDIKGNFQCDGEGNNAYRFDKFVELPEEQRCKDCENSEYYKKVVAMDKWKKGKRK